MRFDFITGEMRNQSDRNRFPRPRFAQIQEPRNGTSASDGRQRRIVPAISLYFKRVEQIEADFIADDNRVQYLLSAVSAPFG